MPTFRESISRVRSLDKLLSADNVISDRAIQAELRSSAILFIKRETDKRKLWTSDSLFTPLPCVELKEVPIGECCDYTTHETIARSIYKLPKIAEGNFQRLIQGVYNISNRKRIMEVSIDRYIN